MKSLALAFALTLCSLAPAAVQSSEIADAKAALERAAYAQGTDALLEARGAFERLAQATPKSAAMQYWVAVADWRLVPRLKDEKLAKRYCKDGLDRADRALALDPKFVEALAIKASLQGLWLRYAPQEVMTIGAEIESNMERAIASAPMNPRIALLDAMNTLHKPAFVGGGADRAAPKFAKAVERFAKDEATDEAAPDWGRLDAWVWSGRCAMQSQDPQAALAFYRQALVLSPENGWVAGVLIPEAEKALAAGDGGAKAAAESKTPGAPKTTAESAGGGKQP